MTSNSFPNVSRTSAELCAVSYARTRVFSHRQLHTYVYATQCKQALACECAWNGTHTHTHTHTHTPPETSLLFEPTELPPLPVRVQRKQANLIRRRKSMHARVVKTGRRGRGRTSLPRALLLPSQPQSALICVDRDTLTHSRSSKNSAFVGGCRCLSE